MGNANSGRPPVPLANQVKAYNLLVEVLVRGFDGKVVYKDDWTDEKVAAEAKISVNHAAVIRRKNFGALAKHTLETKEKRKSLRRELEDLKKLIDHDRTQIRILTTEVQSLWKLLEEKTDA